MIEFGNTLRQAREAKGLTLEQVAETTHIIKAQLEALENEEFDKFSAPIYVRGYIKLFCEALGIDHKPLVDEFMEIYNGNREPAIKERPVSTPEPAVVQEAPIDAEEPPSRPADEILAKPTITETSLFGNDDEVSIKPEPAIPAPNYSGDDERIDQPPSLSRYAAPIREYGGSTVPYARFLRIGVLAIVVIACCSLIFIGLKALYSATTPENADKEKLAEVQKIDEVLHPEKRATKAVQEKPAAKSTMPAAPRTPQKIPALYID